MTSSAPSQASGLLAVPGHRWKHTANCKVRPQWSLGSTLQPQPCPSWHMWCSAPWERRVATLPLVERTEHGWSSVWTMWQGSRFATGYRQKMRAATWARGCRARRCSCQRRSGTSCISSHRLISTACSATLGRRAVSASTRIRTKQATWWRALQVWTSVLATSTSCSKSP